MKRLLVLAFAGWHLAFLLFRNPVSVRQASFDAWVSERRAGSSWAGRAAAEVLDGLDRAFMRYEHALGLDQGWRMFVAPLARDVAFPAVRIELDDGTSVTLRSENEPADPDGFFLRPAKERLRKHETQVVSSELADMGLSSYWDRYLTLTCRQWRAAHPEDGRRVVGLTLLRRSYSLPAPDQQHPAYGQARVDEVGSMRGDACNSSGE